MSARCYVCGQARARGSGQHALAFVAVAPSLLPVLCLEEGGVLELRAEHELHTDVLVDETPILFLRDEEPRSEGARDRVPEVGGAQLVHRVRVVRDQRDYVESGRLVDHVFDVDDVLVHQDRGVAVLADLHALQGRHQLSHVLPPLSSVRHPAQLALDNPQRNLCDPTEATFHCIDLLDDVVVAGVEHVRDGGVHDCWGVQEPGRYLPEVRLGQLRADLGGPIKGSQGLQPQGFVISVNGHDMARSVISP